MALVKFVLGPKVISQVITPHAIQVLTKVLKRKPVIWDNIHANDYDHRRVFLGPYDGRPVQLYPTLNGILTNPNCEFESNFIPIHTLATWTKCAQSAFTTPEEPMSLDQETEKAAERASECQEELNGEPMDAEPEEGTAVAKDDGGDSFSTEYKPDGKSTEAPSDIKDVSMEPETTSQSEGKSSKVLKMYDPQSALLEAVKAWLAEFSKVKVTSSRFYAKSGAFVAAPAPVPVQSYSSMPVTTVTTNSVGGSLCSSKATPTLSATQTAKKNSRRKARESPSPPPAQEKTSEKDVKKEDETPMEVATELFKETDKEKGSKMLCKLTVNDLLLLVDLFYLPYHHGTKAKHLVGEFKWLKNNAVKEDSEEFQELTEQEQKAKISEWTQRSEKFHLLCSNVSEMFVRLAETPNRALLYDLYPYVWDVKEVVLLLDTFITWLGSKSKKKKQKSGFFPEDPEPWVFRGGICADLQRLLPIDGGHEMFSLRAPDVPTMCVYTIRPYQPPDEKSLYDICLLTCDDGQDGHDLFPNEHKKPGDRFIKPYLQICPENVFVVEDEYGLCGYALATTDAKLFYEQCKTECLPEMCKKYSKPDGDLKDWTYSEQISNSFHNPDLFLPNDLYSKYKAHVRIDILPRAQGRELGKRLLACMLSALKDEGVTGVYCELTTTNRDALEFYTKLGFHDVALKDDLPEDIIILGRTF